MKNKKTFLRCSALTFLIVSFFQLILNVSAQVLPVRERGDQAGFRLIRQDRDAVRFSFTAGDLYFSDCNVNGRQMVNVQVPGNFLPNNEGAPNLPGSGRYIAIPQGAQTSFRIISEKTKTYGNIDLAPAPRIPKVVEEGPPEYSFDPMIYNSDAFYPADPVILSKPMKIRGVDVIMIGVTPFQYNPVRKELIVYHELIIEVEIKGGQARIGEERLRNRFWEPVLSSSVLNHQALPPVNDTKRNGSRSEGYEYLILIPDDPAFMRWADSLRLFRIKQGISTTVVTTAQIGGNTATAIENYIDDAYNTWTIPPAAVLLIGDYGTTGNTITSPVWNNYCISDNIYADVDNDDLPDILLARITARDETDLEHMIGKVLEYERNPPTEPGFYDHPVVSGGWQTERWFILCTEIMKGFWENELGKDPIREYAIYSGTPGNSWSSNPNTQAVVNYFGPGGLGYIPATPSYLDDWGGNATRINNDLNAGAFMIIHRDHGFEEGWGEPSYTNTSLQSLDNEYYPFVFSLNCLTGKFNYSEECFAEAFHRSSKRALGITAATEVSYSFVNDVFAWGMWDNMWSDFDPGYGSNDSYGHILPCVANAYGKYYLQASSWPYNPQHKAYTYHLFHHHGDAFTTVFSEVPEDLSVTCDSVLTAGSTSFIITADAYSMIALTCDTLILGVATGTGNPVEIAIPPLVPPDTLLVTVTKQNYFRYGKKIPVVVADGPFVVYYADSISDASELFPNGLLDYGESVLLTLGVKNYGSDTASNVTVLLRTDDPFITLTDTTADYGDIPPGVVSYQVDAYAFDVSEFVPDGQLIQFEVAAISEQRESSWISNFSLLANAPTYYQSADTIDFGPVVVGDSLASYCRVRNDGHCPLSGTIYTPENYYVNSTGNDTLDYSLDPGETQGFWLGFAPDQIAMENDSVLITSNDPNHPDNYIIVFAEGIVYQPTELSASLDVFTGEVSLEWNFDTIPGFYEDFEDGIADNFLFNTAGISVNDGYLKMTGPFQTSWPCALYDEDFHSFEMEASVRKVGQTYSSFFGIFIRANGFKGTGYEGGYTFEIATDGRYRVSNYYSGYQDVIDWGFTDAINEGLGATNVLKVYVIEDTFYYFINGIAVYAFTDHTHPEPGKVNLYTVNSTSDDIWWDNVSVTPIITRSGAGRQRLSGEFQQFNIYRNGELLANTSSQNYTDLLEDYGNYQYAVTALYDIGESYPAGPEIIYWHGYPVMGATPDSLLADLQSGEMDDTQSMTITNTGDSTLIFKLDVTDTTQSRSLWDLQFCYPVEIGEGEGGGETDGNYLYTSKVNSGIFFKYTMEGTFAGSFTIPNCGQIWDLAYDGTYFYGAQATTSSASTTLRIMDFETQSYMGAISAPCEIMGIAYNDDLDAFYANNVSSDIVLFDRQGNILNAFPVESGRMYTGLAYDNYSAGGPYLWGFGRDCGIGLLVQMDASTGLETGVTIDVVNNFGPYSYSGGLYIHPNIAAGKVTIGGVMIDGQLFGYELCDYTINSWIIPDPVSGTVAGARGSSNIGITFNAAGLKGGDYYGNIRIKSNDPVDPLFYVPAHLHVTGVPDISLNFGYDSTSLKYFTDVDTLTTHHFFPEFDVSQPAKLTVSIDGDFNQIQEYADIYLGDSMIGRINPAHLGTTTRLFTLMPSDINTLIDSGEIDIIVVNSPEVNAGYGEDFHQVTLQFLGPEPDTLTFDDVIVGTSLTKEIVISNVGTDILTISDIQCSNDVFTVNTASLILNPDSSFICEVTFTPDDYILEEGILTVTSDDPDAPTSQVVLKGTGVYPPEISVNPDSFTEEVYVGDTVHNTLNISNNGLSDLQVEISVDYLSRDHGEIIDSLFYDNGDGTADGFFGSIPGPTCAAARFTPENVFTLTHVRLASRTGSNPAPVSVAIVRGGATPSMGTLLHTQYSYCISSTGNFFYIPLSQPFTFYTGEDFWIVVTHNTAEQTPQGFDSNVPGADGRYYYFRLGSWSKPSNNAAFIIRAIEDVNWLSIDPISGTIPPDESQPFDVLIDATSLNWESYQANIVIDHNDINSPQVVIPVTVNVTGTPEIYLSSDSLAFDTTFVNYSRIESIHVINIGTNTLNVSDISSDSAEYVADTAGFTLLPGESVMVNVEFTPSTAGLRTGSLTIMCDDLSDPVIEVPLTGVGLDPPVIEIEPETITETLYVRETSSQLLNIANTGLSDLDVSISYTYLDSLALAPVMANSAPEIIIPVITPDNTLAQSEPQIAPDFYPVFSPDHGGRLVSDSIFYDDGDQTPDSFVGDGSTVQPFSAATRFTPLREFTLTHVRIYFRTESYSDSPDVEIYFGGSTPDQGILIHEQEYPLVSDNTGQFYCLRLDQSFEFEQGEDFWIVIHYRNSIKWPQGTDDDGSDCENRCYYSMNQGASWQNAGDILGDGNPDAWIIRAIDDTPMGWLSVDPMTVTVPMDSNFDMTVGFDASSLIPGEFSARIDIASNDPATPQVSVPVSLTVTGVPSIYIFEDSLMFDTMYVGYPLTDSIILKNIGTSLLSVTDVVSSEPDFTVTTSSFTIEPNETYTLQVIFTPESTGMITAGLDIFSNDPFNPVKTVIVSGTGIDPPIIDVEPDALFEEMFQGGTASQSFEISNTGGSDLEVNISVDLLDQGDRAAIDSIYYDDGNSDSDNFWGTNGSAGLVAATRFTAPGPFHLSHIRAFYRTESSTESITIGIYRGGQLPDEGTLLHEQTFNGLSATGKFFYIPMEQIHSFTAGEDFWVVMHYDISVNYAMGCDQNGGQDRTYSKSDQGSTWYYNEEWSWVIRAIDETGWVYVYPIMATIAQSSGQTFHAHVDASGLDVGVYEANILIQSNDPASPLLVLPVELTVNGIASMFISPDSILFDTTFVGQSRIDSLVISNLGSDTLKVTNIVAARQVFSVDTTCFNLPESGQMVVHVSFAPEVDVFYTSDIVIYSNDPDHPVYPFPVSGVGVYPPTIGISPRSLAESLISGNTSQDSLMITNTGTTDLLYSSTIVYLPQEERSRDQGALLLYEMTGVQIEPDGRKDVSPFVPKQLESSRAAGDILLDLDIQTPTGCNRLLGGEFDGTFLYASGSCSPNQLFKFDMEGNLIASYNQNTTSVWGIRDLAVKDGYIYGGDENGFYRFDPSDGDVVTLFTGNLGMGCIRALAYKPGLGFLSNNWGEEIIVFDEDGNILDDLADPGLTSTYGMAYDDAEDCLWLFDGSGDPATTFYQYDLSTEALTGVSYQVPLLTGATDQLVGGAFLAADMFDTKVILGGVTQGDPVDRIFAMELRDMYNWLSIESNGSGILAPAETTTMEVGFDATGLESGVYDAFIQFNSNDPFHPSDTIPVSLFVIDENSPTIAGTVAEGRTGIAGVLIGGTLTDGDGAYQIQVPHGWSGTLTPYKECYEFTPVSRAYQNITSDETNQDYEGFMADPVTISGNITDGTSALDGVAVVFAGLDTVFTDQSGHYCNSVPCGWSGTITAKDSCYDFLPSVIEFSHVIENQNNKNFYGTEKGPYIISGTIDDGSAPIENASVIFEDLDTIYTNPEGYYARFVECCWSGSVSVEFNDLTFLPDSRDYSCILSDCPDQDFTGYDLDVQSFDIPPGWSGISSYIEPLNDSVTEIFESIEDELIILRQGENSYWPAFDINTIGTWNSHYGYTINMVSSMTLTMSGFLDPDHTVEILPGWSTIPVISMIPVSTSDLFEPLEDTIVMAKEVAGGDIYWPAFEIYSLDSLYPGIAYYLSVNDTCSITYPDTIINRKTKPVHSDEPLYVPWNQPTPTPWSHVIVIDQKTLAIFESGDIIGCFTMDGLCSGMVEINSRDKNLALVVFGNDLLTKKQTTGFNEKEPMSYRLYRPSMQEIRDLHTIFDPKMPDSNHFATNGLSRIVKITIGPVSSGTLLSDGHIRIYPNPAHDELIIRHDLMDVDELQISLFSIQGRLIKTDRMEGKSATVEMRLMEPGIYIIRIYNEKYNIIRRIIKY